MLALPTEIWGLIVSMLQSEDQRTCLFVSRMHHDLAFSNLFSHITVVFGLWAEDAEEARWGKDEHARMIRTENISRDILSAISSRPVLARVVRTLTVRARPLRYAEEIIVETRAYVKPSEDHNRR